MRARTLVSFHAHPDDEALLTGGSLARAARAGHRVVLVVATAGEAGLASASAAAEDGLGRTRLTELAVSAKALGCARVVCLDLPDSGWNSGTGTAATGFSALPVERAAEPLIRLLRRERPDVLTIYDPAGGYGHLDHRQVHDAGTFAAQAAGVGCVLEATLPRERLLRVVRLAARVPGLLDSVRPADFEQAYTPRCQITYRVDVRSTLAAKRAAMEAHASQATSDIGPRTLSLLLRLPGPLFSRVCGTEWFTERSGPSAIAAEVLGLNPAIQDQVKVRSGATQQRRAGWEV